MTDRLVGGYHRSCKLKAAVVAVVLHQGQRVVLFWRRGGREGEKRMYKLWNETEYEKKKKKPKHILITIFKAFSLIIG